MMTSEKESFIGGGLRNGNSISLTDDSLGGIPTGGLGDVDVKIMKLGGGAGGSTFVDSAPETIGTRHNDSVGRDKQHRV